MKKIVLSLLIIISLSLQLYSQINFRVPSESNSKTKTETETLYKSCSRVLKIIDADANVNPYDSLSNISENNVEQHIGQTLCFIGDENSHNRGYILNFYHNPFIDNPEDSVAYAPYRWTDVYGKERSATNYDDMINQSFIVSRVFVMKYTPKISTPETTYYDKNHILELVNTQRGDTIYWEYGPIDYIIPPFITLGFYDHLKKSFLGDIFIYEATHGIENVEGERLKYPEGTKFTCTDITINQNPNTRGRQPILVLYSPNYNKIEMYLNRDNNGINGFMSQAYEQKFIKRFGKKFGPSIARGIADIGMTKEMVEAAMGRPSRVSNQSQKGVVITQWIYSDDIFGNTYVHFKNGIVYDIQD